MSDEFKNKIQSQSWDDTPEEQAALGKTNFLKLEEGDTFMRILGKYIYRSVHYVPDGNYKYIICCGDGCPLCMKGNLSGLSYYINILNRKDEKVYIYRFGPGIKKKFQNMVSKYGDLSAYDIIITRTGKDLSTKYDVLPCMKSKDIGPELVTYISANMYDLEAEFKIPTPQEILEQSAPSGTKPGADAGKKPVSSNDFTGAVHSATPQTSVEEGKPNATDKSKCFGKFFNPISPICTACEMKENCKNLVLSLYQQKTGVTPPVAG